MDCLSLAACTSPASGAHNSLEAITPATTQEQQRGHRFAELLESGPASGQVYVSAPEVSASTGNPVVGVLSSFQALEFSNAAPNQVVHSNESLLSDFEIISNSAIEAQMSIFKTAMAMEVMNSAKQGVTTLFQQQG